MDVDLKHIGPVCVFYVCVGGGRGSGMRMKVELFQFVIL